MSSLGTFVLMALGVTFQGQGLPGQAGTACVRAAVAEVRAVGDSSCT